MISEVMTVEQLKFIRVNGSYVHAEGRLYKRKGKYHCSCI